MARRRRHFMLETSDRYLCGQPYRPEDKVVTTWKQVDCLQCQVKRYLTAKKVYDKRRAAAERRRATLERRTPLLNEEPVMQGQNGAQVAQDTPTVGLMLADEVRAEIRRFHDHYPLPACPDCNTGNRLQARTAWISNLTAHLAATVGGVWGYTDDQHLGLPTRGFCLTSQLMDGNVAAWQILEAPLDEECAIRVNNAAIECRSTFFRQRPTNMLQPMPPPALDEELEKSLDEAARNCGPGPVTYVPSDHEFLMRRIEGLEAQLQAVLDQVVEMRKAASADAILAEASRGTIKVQLEELYDLVSSTWLARLRAWWSR